MGPSETLLEFLDQGVVIREFPNRIAPEGRMGRVDALQGAYEQGRKIMRSQRYQIQNIIESGDDIAVELEWTGTLAVPLMGLAAGSTMKAFVAMFLRIRRGKIVEQRNYDFYPVFEGASRANETGK